MKPELRIKGCRDEWKEKKFSELYKPSSKKNKDENIGYDKMISVGSMTYLNDYARAKKDSLSSYRVMDEGDIAFEGHKVKGYDFGRFVANDIGTGIISPIFTSFTPKGEMSNDFWKQYIHSDAVMRNKLEICTNAGVMMNKLVVKDFLNQSILVPGIEEQKNIGKTLKTMDEMIAYSRKEIERLKQIKKASLSVMFPQEGETKPRLRFKGFTDDWEQRELNEVADFNPKSELPDEFKYIDLESVVGTEMVAHRTENKEAAPSRAQRLAKTGDVFFQTVRPYQRNNYLFLKPDNNYVFSTGYAQMRPKIDAEFLMCSIQTDSFVKMVLDNCTGTSYPAINASALSKLKILMPVSSDEQSKIGSFITNLDHLITLHQRELKKLENVKSAMLRQMFPKTSA